MVKVVKETAKANTPKAVKPVALKLLTGAEAINTLIQSIAKRGKAMDKDIHIAAVSSLVHADKHGDITLANKLIDALPSSSRKNALRDWYIAFGKFRYNDEAKKLGYNGDAVTQTDTAIATPFWEFKPEAEYVPFNAEQFLDQAMKRVSKAMEKGDAVPTGMLEGLNKLKLAIVAPDPLAQAA